VARVGIQVAEALAYAHGQGILHRDIKPSNLLLDTQGTVWVTDFGLAKATGSEDLTHPGDIVGTIRYLAPERFEAKADARSDVYALGLTLYELLTLRPAFAETDRNKLVAQVMHAEPPRPRQVQPEVPRDLETIVLKALAREPARRYPSATELAEDLKRFVAGEPIRARRVSAGKRLLLWAKRRPAAAALLAVSGVAALALVGLVVGQVYNQQLSERNARIQSANEQLQAAQEQTARALQAEARARQEADEARRSEAQQLYFHRIALAEREWYANNVGRTEQLLEECPLHLRGWEWHYLQRLCHTDLLTRRDHTGFVSRLALSRDGHWLATAGQDKTIRLWDAATQQARRTLQGHTGPITAVVFDPEGTRLVSAANSGSGPGEVKLWDLATGQEILAFLGHQSPVNALALSPDGQRLAAAIGHLNYGGEIRLWDANTGQALRTLGVHAGPVMSVAFSPDGHRLAAASHPANSALLWKEPGEVKVWDAATGQEVLRLRGHTAAVDRVLFSPDGRRLASASQDATIRIWEAQTGQELVTLRGHSRSVTSLIFSADGQVLASASEDQTVRTWNARTGQEVRIFRGHTGPVQDVLLTSSDRRLLSCSADATVKAWDVAEDQGAYTFVRHTSWAFRTAFSPEGQRLASSGDDGLVKVWNPTTGQEIFARRIDPFGARWVTFSPDGRRLATASVGRTVQVWDVDTEQRVLTLRHSQEVHCVAFSPDGQRLVAVGGNRYQIGEAKVWNATTGEEIFPLRGHAAMVWTVAFSPEGQRLATASRDQTVKVWDATTGQEIRTLRGHADEVEGVVFSPDGRRLASASYDRTVKVWNADTGEVLLTLRGHTALVCGVAFSPDGRRLASASYDRTVKLWDALTGQEILTLRGHTQEVLTVVFSPDGQRLASGSAEGTVKLWETTPQTPEVRLQREAASLVNRLAVELLFKDAVRARLRGDASLGEPVRQVALALVERYREDPYRFYQASWAVVQKGGADEATYRLALRHAEAAYRQSSPQEAFYRDYLNTLGVAQYRVGQYAGALDSLARADALYSARVKTGVYHNLAFLAMAHHRLGHKDQAQAALGRLKEAMKAPRLANSVLAQALLREAKALLTGQAVEPEP
jgi:WD40 repeat protein